MKKAAHKKLGKMKLTKKQENLLNYLKDVAIEMNKRQEGYKDKSTFTSLIGELAACKCLGLKWEPSNGYDALNGKKTIQIKSRRPLKGDKVNIAGRMGRFGKKDKYDFDFGILVLLDKNYEVDEIYRRSKKDIKDLEERKEPTERGLHLSTFINDIKPIYP